MSATRTTVITIVRNGERYLEQALRSIKEQTRPVDEIIIVDGQSTDGTARIASSFTGVKYLLQHDLGIANARNLGISAATGNYIAFLDHDDRWLPEKLELQISHLQRRPELCFTTTMVRWFSEGNYPHHLLYEQNRFTHGRIGQMPGTLVARREAFETIGAYDPALTIACDQEWFVRGQDMMVKSGGIPDVLLEKRLHERNISAQIELYRSEWLQVLRQSLLRKSRAHGHGYL